jgi:hypothetical protein
MAAIKAARTRGVAATFSGMGIPAAGDTPSRDGAALRTEDGAIGSAGFNSSSATIDRDTIGTSSTGMVAIRLAARPYTCCPCLAAGARMEAATTARPKGIGRIRAADDEDRDQDGGSREQTFFHGRIPHFKN